jgi:hypothetical protein
MPHFQLQPQQSEPQLTPVESKTQPVNPTMGYGSTSKSGAPQGMGPSSNQGFPVTIDYRQYGHPDYFSQYVVTV